MGRRRRKEHKGTAGTLNEREEVWLAKVKLRGPIFVRLRADALRRDRLRFAA